MKTTLTKIVLLGIAGAIAFALCSFKANVSTTDVNVSTNAAEDEWAEYYKVQDFVQANITKPISEKNTSPKSKMSAFSRCPSGYQPEFMADYKEVKTDKEVTGKLELYRGCSPKHICDFKVNVAKKIALVRSNDSEEYVTVNEWLKKTQPQVNSTVKNTKTVKG